MFDSDVWMLYSDLAMHNVLWMPQEAYWRNEHTRRVDDSDNVVESDLFEDWVK